ncbi:MAG: hypothetical protein ACLRSD_01605 [Oscillibacter sp.]
MDEKLFSARMAEYKSAVDKYLDACLEETQCASYHKLTDSMHYSLTAGGKRLRAILVLRFRASAGRRRRRRCPWPAALRCCTRIRSSTTICP